MRIHAASQSSATPARPLARVVLAYAAAVALAMAAVFLRYFLEPWMGRDVPYAILFGAVGIAVWMGGSGPAVVTAALGTVLVRLLIVRSPGFEVGDALGLALYALSCGVMIALGANTRRAKQLHGEAEQRFRGSHEASIQGFCFLCPLRDATGQIVDFTYEYINPLGASYVQSTPDALIGRRVTEVLPNARNTDLFRGCVRVAETGTPLDVEACYERDGASAWFRHFAVRVGNEIALSYSDITQSKRLEQELKQRAAELERADLNKSQFLATLSHELRNPMAPLRNGLAVLRMRKGVDNTEMLALMDRQLSQLVRLVDDLLDVSRIDRGKIELKRERVTVDSIVSAAVETARPMIDGNGHELLVHFAHHGACVEGDAVRLAQVVSNLLLNAAKFTPANGRIALTIQADTTHVVISVADNGIGIAHEHLEHIFEMFVQLDPSKTQVSAGLGLGLALVQSLVQLHQGQVEARSAGPGRGSEFIVTLPKAADSGTHVVAALA